MNIFILDNEQHLSSQYHCDKHIVKMPLELTQMLCTAHYFWETKDIPYKKAYENHPCSQWVRESATNYWWALCFGRSLCNEYTYRYGKTHACSKILNWCQDNFSAIRVKKEELTPFALAMPDEYKCSDPVQSYRNYYNGEKKHLFKWTKRPTPPWISIGEHDG